MAPRWGFRFRRVHRISVPQVEHKIGFFSAFTVARPATAASLRHALSLGDFALGVLFEDITEGVLDEVHTWGYADDEEAFMNILVCPFPMLLQTALGGSDGELTALFWALASSCSVTTGRARAQHATGLVHKTRDMFQQARQLHRFSYTLTPGLLATKSQTFWRTRVAFEAQLQCKGSPRSVFMIPHGARNHLERYSSMLCCSGRRSISFLIRWFDRLRPLTQPARRQLLW